VDRTIEEVERRTVPHVRHAVQFYDGEGFLVETVAEYVAEGLGRGTPALVIATQAHRDEIVSSLAARGLDVGKLMATGALTMRDCFRTLDLFMVDGELDAERFHAEVGDLVRTVRGGSSTIRLFGEMVDVLWREGNEPAVLGLEALWNELMANEHAELLCAYEMAEFAEAAHTDAFARICRHHHHVLPTESYSRISDVDRLLEISSLQQRAKSLETELQQRALLEHRLREALEQRERLLEEERTARGDAERARILAQEANRARNTFLAVMSHELRTPLNAIGGYADLLVMDVFGSLTDEQREALERLQQSQRHLLGLIDQVLGYADAGSSVARYEISEVQLGDILESVEHTMAPQLAARGIRYDRSAADMSLVVRADPTRTRQILVHLLTNALKFTDAGGFVELRTGTRGNRALIQVRDTGIGIPQEDLTMIFEPFLQGDSALTRTRGGIGLGLALSRDFARAMHGELSAASVEGEGSTFTLALPMG